MNDFPDASMRSSPAAPARLLALSGAGRLEFCRDCEGLTLEYGTVRLRLSRRGLELLASSVAELIDGLAEGPLRRRYAIAIGQSRAALSLTVEQLVELDDLLREGDRALDRVEQGDAGSPQPAKPASRWAH